MKAPVQRFLSALCALSFLLAALFPTAALAAGADDLAVSNTLTREDAAQMQEADSAVAALTDSGDFAALSRAERFAAAQAQLQQLAEQGLVSVRSIYIDEANGMVSFSKVMTPADAEAVRAYVVAQAHGAPDAEKGK